MKNCNMISCSLCYILFPLDKLTKIQPKSSDEYGKSVFLCKKCTLHTLKQIVDKVL